MKEIVNEIAVEAKIQMVSEPRLEHFMTLIVSKCRDIIQEQREISIEHSWGVDESMACVINSIEETFGIEK